MKAAGIVIAAAVMLVGAVAIGYVIADRTNNPAPVPQAAETQPTTTTTAAPTTTTTAAPTTTTTTAPETCGQWFQRDINGIEDVLLGHTVWILDSDFAQSMNICGETEWTFRMAFGRGIPPSSEHCEILSNLRDRSWRESQVKHWFGLAVDECEEAIRVWNYEFE